MIYRSIEMRVKVVNRRMFRQYTTTDSQYIHLALYGRLCSKMETMPVPIVTENHLG